MLDQGDRGISVKGVEELLFDELRISRERQFAVAYSGGVDSAVLLHVMLKLRDQFDIDLIALHFDHGLNVDSSLWRQHCGSWCQDNDIPFFFHRDKISAADGESLEAVARTARYKWFEAVASHKKVVLTAHHLDDQVETILMNLFQGKSAQSLLGMPRNRPLSFGSAQWLVRPFLDFGKNQVLQYAKENKLDWIVDTSNDLDAFDRNYVRNQVIPLIKARWPSAAVGINRTSQKLVTVSTLYQGHIESLFRSAVSGTKKRLFCLTNPLTLSSVSDLAEGDFNEVIRLWVHGAKMASPSDASLTNLYQQLVSSGFERGELRFRHARIICFSGCLYLMEIRTPRRNPSINQERDASIDPRIDKEADGDLAIQRSGCGYNLKTKAFPMMGVELTIENRPEQGIDPHKIKQKSIQLVWRKGGERIRLPKRNHRHYLKKVYQERAIPPWERDDLPMISADGEVIWISGIGVVNGYQCEEENIGICPQFKRLCD